MPDATNKENLPREIAELRQRIRELERREAILRESEERYRGIYDNSPLSCFTIDLDGRIQDCNPLAGQLTGYPVDELLGKPVLDLYADTARGKIAAAEVLSQLLDGQSFEDEVLEMRKADGTLFWGSLTTSIVRNTAGDMMASQAVVLDITDRQAAKAALLHSERRYRLMFDLVPDGVIVLDANGIIVDCSRSACGLYRRSRAALLGQRITDLMPSASANATFDSFWATLQQMSPVDAETQIACGNGAILHVQRRAVPISDERGDFAGAMINDRDISSQVLTTLALHRSEKFAQVILEASRDAIVLTDVQGNILESYKTSGEDNAVGKNIFDILPPNVRESRRVHFEQVVQTAQPLMFEDENEGVILENWIYPVFDEQGQVVGLAGFTRNITERHQMSEALQKSESRLQHAQAVGHVGSWEYDISTGQIWGSEEGFRIYGLPVDTGQLPIDEIEAHIPDREIIHQALIDLIEHDVPYDLEFEILPHGSEEKKIISSIAELVRDEEGNPQRVVGVIQDITKRKLAEQALREREARLQRIFEVLPVGLWFADKDGTLLGGNPAGVRIWGAEPLVDIAQYGVFKARRLPSGEEIAPDDWALTRTIREGIAVTDEMLEIDAFDGHKKTILNYTAPILDDYGQIQGAIVVNQDITAQMQAERALRESEARFRAIFRSSAMGMAVTDLTGRFITTNPAFRRIVGYTKDELLAMRFRDLTHPDELPADLTLFEELISGQRQEYRREKRYIHKEGRTVPVRLTVSLMRDDEDEPQFTVGIVEDITEERRAQEALQASELRLQHITQQVPVSVWSADCALRITYHSGSITSKQAEMLERGQIVGHRLPDIYQTLLDPKTGQKIIGYVRRALAGETVSYIHEPQDRQIENVISPLRDESGQVIGLVGVAMDVTERRRLEDQLRQSQKFEALGTLASGVAHDFNNLLTTITGFTELALRQVEKDSALHKDLGQVRRAAMRGTNLTRQLLLFSRRQPVEVRSLDITAVVEDLLKMLGRLLGEDVTISVELGQELAPILGDAGQIEQVIVNLAINARDAMPEGGEITIGTAHAHVDAEWAEQQIDARAGDFVCLTVSDTGCGIDPAMLPHIFEPFFTTKEAGKGTGLGLAVVYGIVKQHGGWIDVSSEPDVSTTFRIYFPVTTGAPASTAAPSSDVDHLRGKGERLLLIEDEEFVRRFATRLLTDQGYQVVAVEDATEAFATFEQEAGKFDLVFSDVILPDGNGLDVVLQLLKHKPALKVLFASGYTDERSKSAIIQEHHFHYLAKPYAVADLLQAIRQVLDNEDSD